MTKLKAGLAGCALTAVALLTASCEDQTNSLRSPLPPPVLDGVPAAALTDADKGQAARKMMVIRHRLTTIQLPLGAVSDTEQIWGYINEEPLGAKLGTCLARNGIRVGVGRESDWPAIAKILRRLTGQPLMDSNTMARPGQPIPVALKKDQGTQTIFMFRPDETLFGNDYPAGDNLLVITAGTDYDDPRTVRISGVPVVRSSYRRARYVKGPAGYELKSESLHYPLDQLAFEFGVPPGGFLIIGPGPEVRRQSSPGNRFLVRQTKGASFETLLVIAPEVFAVPVRVVK